MKTRKRNRKNRIRRGGISRKRGGMITRLFPSLSGYTSLSSKTNEALSKVNSQEKKEIAERQARELADAERQAEAKKEKFKRLAKEAAELRAKAAIQAKAELEELAKRQAKEAAEHEQLSKPQELTNLGEYNKKIPVNKFKYYLKGNNVVILTEHQVTMYEQAKEERKSNNVIHLQVVRGTQLYNQDIDSYYVIDNVDKKIGYLVYSIESNQSRKPYDIT
jgi:hypothetical protein